MAISCSDEYWVNTPTNYECSVPWDQVADTDPIAMFTCDIGLNVSVTTALCDVPFLEVGGSLPGEHEDPITQLVNILILAFETPSAEAIQTAFMAGCTLPLIAYLVAWGYQVVINFATTDKE